jgi:hypothetical protein
MENHDKPDEIKAQNRPRIILVFRDATEFSDFERYANSKGLDVKSFAKFAMKTYMDKYPRVTRKTR